MTIGDRLRELRERKQLSQGDIEKRTGLLRCYISRVENGQTVPAIDTLEKMARALEIPLYQLFYEGEGPPQVPNLLKKKTPGNIVWGSSGKEAAYFGKLRNTSAKQGKRTGSFCFPWLRNWPDATAEREPPHKWTRSPSGWFLKKRGGTCGAAS
jgi:transcriptional regulator with XRE-family HTH domain